MLRSMLVASTLALLVFMPVAQAANTDSPVGTWKTFDDKTGDAMSIVKIHEVNGELKGKVIQVLKSDQGPHPICKKCEGERHNQPVEGMTIIWGMQRHGDEWKGGHILDPHNGKSYKCKMSLKDGGEKLEVRGYIGISLFGRSQTWQRVPPPEPEVQPAAEPNATGAADADTVADQTGVGQAHSAPQPATPGSAAEPAPTSTSAGDQPDTKQPATTEEQDA